MKIKVILTILFITFSFVGADWKEKIAKASLEYADTKKNELVAEYNKKAIIGLYKKLYPRFKNKSDKDALKAFAGLGINVTKINNIASGLASGDEKIMQKATEDFGIEIGKRLNKKLKNPYFHNKMKNLLGGVDEIRNISKILGEASTGDNKALYEYAATTFINAAGGGGVMSFYTTAHGVMKFAKDAYMDSTIEELYQKYKQGKMDKSSFNIQTTLGGYATVIRDKMIEERKKKLAQLGDIDIPDKLLKHLTNVSESDIEKEIFAGFKARKIKESKDLKNKNKIKKAQEEAENILKELNDVASKKYDKNWIDKDKYSKLNLSKYISIIYKHTKAHPNLKVTNPIDLKVMSRLLATKMIHGSNSKEYKEELKKFNKYIKNTKGVNIKDDPLIPVIDSNLLKGKDLKENIIKRLPKLNHNKIEALMKRVGKKVPKNFYSCLCIRDGGGASSGVGVSYHPGIIEPYNERYSCHQPGFPCMAQGYGCWRFPLPNDINTTKYCIEHSKYDDNSTIVDAIMEEVKKSHTK